MASNPVEIRGKLPDLVIRGSNVVPITESVGFPQGVGMAAGRDFRLARGKRSGNYFNESGQMDRRSRFRNVKYAAQVAKSKMPIFDVAFLIFWVVFGVYLLLK